MICESCEGEIPEDADGIVEWFLEQKFERFRDKMLYGTSYSCSECGRAFDARKIILKFDDDSTS